MSEILDLLIVGAGPAGLATAYAARQAGLTQLVLERGSIADNIRRYPVDLVFYSTPERIELGDLPLVCSGAKPTRRDAVVYYTRFAGARELPVRTWRNVVRAEATPAGFRLTTHSPVGVQEAWEARAVVLAYGAYDLPNRLEVPGEDLPHVSHYFTDPERYHGCDVLVVGGKGSAAEAALLICRAGGRVTISYRRERFSGLKYWIGPDLENRLAAGEITAHLPSRVREIRPTETVLELGNGRRQVVPTDFVLALTGYQPTTDLFDQLGVRYDPVTRRPEADPRTHASSTPGVYLAGCLQAGHVGNEIFIENGRLHGAAIVADLVRRRATGG